MRLYGIDVGFGWTKYCYGIGGDVLRVECGRFPTAFARFNDAVRVDEVVRYHVFEGGRYVCGEDAVVAGSGFSIRDLDSLVRFSVLAVAEVMRRTWGSGEGMDDVEIAVGLPPADYRAYRELMRERLLEVPVTGCGVVRPRRVEVYPQAVVAKVEMDLNGGMRRGLIVDVGHNTVDVVSVVGGKVVVNDVMTISRGGIARAITEFMDAVRFRYGLTFSTAHEAYEVMCEGRCWSMGREVELSGEVREIVSGYVEWLTAKIRERWEERMRMAEAVVLIGGGARLVGEYFPEGMRGMLRVFSEPEFANCRGYLLLLGKAHGVRLVFGC